MTIEYVATANCVIVYYEIELKFMFSEHVITPCIITLEEWINQGGE